MTTETAPEILTISSDVNYAGYGARLYAYLVDQSIIQCLGIAISLPFYIDDLTNISFESMDIAVLNKAAAIMVATIFAVGVVYGTAMEASPMRATLGKRVKNIALATVKGEKVSFVAILSRNLAINLPVIVMNFWGLSMLLLLSLAYLTPLISARKQTFYDQIMDVLIVKK